MTLRLTRRTLLSCVGTVIASSACTDYGNASPRWRCCCFSLGKGWSNLPAADAFTVVRIAGPTDPSGVPQATRRIQQVLSFNDAFEIRIAEGEDNAMTLVENGRRVMIVDVGFLAKVNRLATTRWAAIQVLAHEIGHHLAQADDPPQNELQADYWSGRALRLLGSARNAASASILAIGTEHDTRTHPNKYSRARAIQRGWDDG